MSKCRQQARGHAAYSGTGATNMLPPKDLPARPEWNPARWLPRDFSSTPPVTARKSFQVGLALPAASQYSSNTAVLHLEY
jgi:hypothetical protein